ncbi:hypothetical protein EVAR_5019_1 [Eumeta japonica]|uniref:Uncharacterized protein n=1 Tax=Eumeta variegata TaxID=151549 RepID=A0A4C1SXB9_EUMVA|nr:hypothetical protein EVAR_5019_1 [Eumeta japonica]
MQHATTADPQEIVDFLRMSAVGMKRVRYLSILWNQYSIIWIEIRSGEADSRVSGAALPLIGRSVYESSKFQLQTSSELQIMKRRYKEILCIFQRAAPGPPAAGAYRA